MNYEDTPMDWRKNWTVEVSTLCPSNHPPCSALRALELRWREWGRVLEQTCTVLVEEAEELRFRVEVAESNDLASRKALDEVLGGKRPKLLNWRPNREGRERA